MTRYRRPKQRGWVDDDWERFGGDDDQPHIPSLTVSEHVAVDTGLVWEDGAPIMRDPNPIGFGRDEEW